MRVGIALLRAVVGGLFMGHGLQKLAGWFGGHGLRGTGSFFESIDLRPGRAHAAAAGAAETAGGALLASGFLTPLGASLLSGTMLTAIRKVHGRNGVWNSDGGYEYNLVLLAAVFAVSDLGPGPWSLDEVLGTRRSGLAWALAQLAGGAIGSSAAVALGERGQAPPITPEQPQPEHNGAGRAADARSAVSSSA